MKKIKDPEELINRRRRQMHVHSTIYYYLNTSIIDDATFDKWAVELANLQKQYPQFKHTGYMHTVFADWTGDTGMHLPVTDTALDLAERLVADAENRTGTPVPIQSQSRQKAGSGRLDAWQGDVGYKPDN